MGLSDGFIDKKDGVFVWSDGSVYSGDNVPGDKQTDMTCVSVMPGGYIETSDCDSELGYICKRIPSGEHCYYTNVSRKVA